MWPCGFWLLFTKVQSSSSPAGARQQLDGVVSQPWAAAAAATMGGCFWNGSVSSCAEGVCGTSSLRLLHIVGTSLKLLVFSWLVDVNSLLTVGVCFERGWLTCAGFCADVVVVVVALQAFSVQHHMAHCADFLIIATCPAALCSLLVLKHLQLWLMCCCWTSAS